MSVSQLSNCDMYFELTCSHERLRRWIGEEFNPVTIAIMVEKFWIVRHRYNGSYEHTQTTWGWGTDLGKEDKVLHDGSSATRLVLTQNGI
jgi:hypothetical protein